MHIQFWGVRGSIAVSGPDTVQTGGNTPCVELRSGGHRLVLDGGTGLQALGRSLGPGPVEMTLLFSHVHWDHIQGVPFFGPLFHPKSEICFLGANRDNGSLRDALRAQMRPPQFPITLDQFNAKLEFRDVVGPFDVGPFRVFPMDLQHPDGVLAYRIEVEGKSIVYATDVEHGDRIDERLVDLCRGADWVVHDAQYTRDEYMGKTSFSRRGWGHSSIEDAMETADRAKAKQLVLFHHDPMRTDIQLANLEGAAKVHFPNLCVAREGRAIELL